ncbi:MAG: T9SS type A sorting domain-containing protein, partial [Fibrobacteres bacterium]|nr:T9SS type A sorting domain-containing protein [Fibrobacterota bacterium]
PASILRPFSGRGVGVGHDGSLYYPTFAKTKGVKWGYGSGVYGTEDFTMTLHKFDSLGNRVKNNLVPMHCFPSMGARVDFKGNVYLGALVKPFGENVPPEIAGELAKDQTGLYSAAYPWYGSILKFSPEGGSILPNSSGGHMTTSQNRLKVDGASWVYYGASIQTSFAYTGGLFYKKECCCFSPRFDVDRFSRVIFPNLFENNYVCLDANKNVLFKIHNRDFVKDSTIVGTGSTVQATDRGLYISDGTNNQILCFSWEAAVEKKMSISTLGTETERNLLSGSYLSAASSPTPFSSTVNISVSSKKNTIPDVAIYDIAGKRVKELSMVSKKGELFVYVWNGCDDAKRQLRNGFYFYRVSAGESSISGRLTLIK